MYTENKLSPPYPPPIQTNTLQYEPSQIQGQCILTSVTPVKKSKPLFILFIIISVLLVGIPLLIIYWYPWLKRKLYYRPCSLEEAKQFHVINYDQVSSFPDKLNKMFYNDKNNAHQVVCFYNRYMLYLVQNYTIKAAQFDFIQRINQIKMSENVQKMSYSTQKDAINLRDSYGLGVMVLKLDSIPVLFLRQVARPLYLFILFSCSLWVYQEYYYYSGIIFITAAIGIITNLIQTYQNNKKIHEMAYNQEIISTLRNGQVVELSSTQLVPGDIVFLKKQIKIPFDGVILEGDALINQCALTGESVPILKKPEKLEKKTDLKTSYIYEGTSLIQVGNKKKTVKFDHYRQKYGVPVIVARTNFATMKGQLIRVISFPKERSNVFERQSTKFLLFLFCLSVISYGILLIKLTQYVQDGHQLFLKFLDLITITVPPGLPVSMTFGIIFALQKMKSKKIFCSSPNKVIHGGLTNWLCFDKTGTLTQDFMDFDCLVLCNGNQFAEPIFNRQGQKQNLDLNNLSAAYPNFRLALNNMAMNHTIVNVEETKENVGDPMEIKLFQFGDFVFSSEQNDNPDIIMAFSSARGHKGFVLKRFDFDSQLFRMSAIGKSSVTADDLFIYVKGSPQIMIDIFRKQTIPPNYQDILKQYASQGFRVLAMGSRRIQANELGSQRLELQSNIDFNGFEVFQNKLKPETRGAIAEFVEAELPCVMITGDNALTGSNMACQCGISDPSKVTLICNFDVRKQQLIFEQFIYKPTNPNQLNQFKPRKHISMLINELNNNNINSVQTNTRIIQVQNQNINNSQNQLETNMHLKQIINRLNDPNIQLCITGAALNRIFTAQKQKTLSRSQSYILLRTTVFARAKPNDKIKAISLYQKLGKKVSMCGDGANDCGALKQADIGLSLSMAEASISAPFTSQVTNISSMVELLKQCRAGLATNFSLFNIMALYSLIQYTTTIITQYNFAYPWDLQYLYWDVFCNMIFFLTIGYTGTAERLSVEIPNSSLFSFSNLFQVILAFALQLVGQILMIVGLGTFFVNELQYSPNDTYQLFLKQQGFVTTCIQNTVLFLFSNIMYIATLVAFSIARPWRKPFYTNPLFMICFIVMTTYCLVMIVVPGSRLSILQINYIDYQPYLWYMFGLAVGFGLLIVVLQKLVLEPISNYLRKRYPQKTWI